MHCTPTSESGHSDAHSDAHSHHSSQLSSRRTTQGVSAGHMAPLVLGGSCWGCYSSRRACDACLIVHPGRALLRVMADRLWLCSAFRRSGSLAALWAKHTHLPIQASCVVHRDQTAARRQTTTMATLWHTPQLFARPPTLMRPLSSEEMMMCSLCVYCMHRTGASCACKGTKWKWGRAQRKVPAKHLLGSSCLCLASGERLTRPWPWQQHARSSRGAVGCL